MRCPLTIGGNEVPRKRATPKGSANFMTPGLLDPVLTTNTHLQSINQAAIQARQQLRAQHESSMPFGPVNPMQADFRAMRAMERRKERGGQTFHKGDMIRP